MSRGLVFFHVAVVPCCSQEVEHPDPLREVMQISSDFSLRTALSVSIRGFHAARKLQYEVYPDPRPLPSTPWKATDPRQGYMEIVVDERQNRVIDPLGEIDFFGQAGEK